MKKRLHTTWRSPSNKDKLNSVCAAQLFWRPWVLSAHKALWPDIQNSAGNTEEDIILSAGAAWRYEQKAVCPSLKYKQCLKTKANIHGPGARRTRMTTSTASCVNCAKSRLTVAGYKSFKGSSESLKLNFQVQLPTRSNLRHTRVIAAVWNVTCDPSQGLL